MKGWLRRHDVCCFYWSLGAFLLAVYEYLFVHRFITGMPSERLDTVVVVLFAAPLATLTTLFLFLLAGKILTWFLPRGK